MKKLALTIASVLTITGAAFAQNINWATPFGSITAQTNAATYSPLFGGGSAGGVVGGTFTAATSSDAYYYELLYIAAPNNAGVQIAGNSAPSNSLTALLTGGWIDAGYGATNGTVAGRLNPIAPNTQAAAPWSQTNNIVLVGWSANIGALGSGQETWLNVSNILANWGTFGQNAVGNAFFGVSATGYILPNGANPATSVFASAAIPGFGLPISSPNTQLYLLPVPEPTTIALAGLGGLSLLLFRRRKV